jgi:prophage antirepressor-like protein|nr:MAG TPA: repressor domain protein [Caudoviricetes sp.]
MREINVFNSEEFGDIRAIEIDNEPWFVGKDVAEALGYSNTRDALATHVSDEDKNTVVISDGKRGNPNQTVINESGLYALIFGSKLESAKRFKHWVTSEVLPAIRKTGNYKMPMTIEEQLQIVAKGTLEVKEEIKRVDNDLQNFKEDIPLLALECQRITRAKNQKVVPLMGGKKAPAYKNKSLMHKVYSDVDAQLRREFGVNTYKAIKRSQCDLAVKIIEDYVLPMYLKEEIDAENSQLSFGL